MSSEVAVTEFISIEIAKLMDLIKYGHELMQKQAEERYEHLKKLLSRSDLRTEKGKEILKLVISELLNIQADFRGLDSQLEIVSLLSETVVDETLNEVLEENPQLMELLNEGNDLKEALAQEILRQEANIMSRDELIQILEEDVQYMQSEQVRLLADLEDMALEIKRLAHEVSELEKIFLHDPKFKAVEVISKHPEGLSYTQLSYLLNVNLSEAVKICIELEQNDFITRSGNIVKPIISEYIYSKV